ncbi:hypothetical protein FACS189494_04830 [Spirochaetia bacterium]|nr:hypothetical protein FACS189494_04830 [Spirochaetia bacterium]
MSKNSWIGFVAFRYISKTGKQSSTTTVLSMVGIAVGVFALTVIIAVMNGFQLGFIESILEISSYHIRIDSFPKNNYGVLDDIRKINNVVSAVRFSETKGIIKENKHSEQQAAVLRGLEEDAYSLDNGMRTHLIFQEGGFDLEDTNSILIGTELAHQLGVRKGSSVDFWTISSLLPQMDADEAAAEEIPPFIVKGVFRCGYYEYDTSWAFINIDTEKLFDSNDKCSLGIKVQNRWYTDGVGREISEILKKNNINADDISISTWRDYNKAFFGALRTEKLLMFVLVGLIFFVVALNIFQSQRRTVLERLEEIALLRSVGATNFGIRSVFAFDGIILGFAGSVAGMVPALLVALNIKNVFSFLEFIVNGIKEFFWNITGSGGETFALFSPTVFYIKEIPSRVIPYEIVLIFLFGFLSAVLASWFASKKASGLQPAEVLRYE